MNMASTIATPSGAPRKGSRLTGRGSRFPRLPLYTALAFVGFAMVAISFGTVTGIGTVMTDQGRPVAMRDIRIVVEADETLRVFDASTGAAIAQFAPGEGGFVRGSQRAFQRMRFVGDISDQAPWRVIRWENGAVSLSDTATGERFYLNAFGKDNAEAFAAFLDGHGAKGGTK